MTAKNDRCIQQNTFLTSNAFVICVFILFLIGEFLQLLISVPILGSISLRRKLLCCGALNAAAYLTIASYYGYFLIPAFCISQGILVGAIAGERVMALVNTVSAQYTLPVLLIQVPVFFLFAWRGLQNAQILNRQSNSYRVKPAHKELFLYTALMLLSAFCSYWSYMH